MSTTAIVPAGWQWSQPNGRGLLVSSDGTKAVTPPTLEEGVDAARDGNVFHSLPSQQLPGRWSIDDILAAVDHHDIGFFFESWRLRLSLTRDPRIGSARRQRTATPTTLPWVVDPAGNARGLARVAAEEAENLISPKYPWLKSSTIRRLTNDFVDYGIAVGQVFWEVNGDATRTNPRVEAWPMQYVWWNAGIGCLQATTVEGLTNIRHGDGHWLVFAPHGDESWLSGVIRELATVWADRTYGIRYRSQHAAVHGSPAPIGTLPKGIAINSPQGLAFQRLVMQLRDGRAAGVKPEGSEIDMFEAAGTSNGSVFRQIVDCADEDIAISYLGHDGTQSKGSVYAAPMLEGVSLDRVALDAKTIDDTINTGIMPIWATINFGDPEFAPAVRRVVPDPNLDARIEANARKNDAFTRALQEYRTAGVDITAPGFLEALARDYNCPVPPLMKVLPPVAPAPEIRESEQKQPTATSLRVVPKSR